MPGNPVGYPRKATAPNSPCACLQLYLLVTSHFWAQPPFLVSMWEIFSWNQLHRYMLKCETNCYCIDLLYVSEFMAYDFFSKPILFRRLKKLKKISKHINLKRTMYIHWSLSFLNHSLWKMTKPDSFWSTCQCLIIRGCMSPGHLGVSVSLHIIEMSEKKLVLHSYFDAQAWIYFMSSSIPTLKWHRYTYLLLDS